MSRAFSGRSEPPGWHAASLAGRGGVQRVDDAVLAALQELAEQSGLVDKFVQMKKGAVLVDVAVDQGGCCETTKATTHDDPTYVVDGVVHVPPGGDPVTRMNHDRHPSLGYCSDH